MTDQPDETQKPAVLETLSHAALGRPVVLTIEQRRKKILRCAQEEFFAGGYGATSMDKIAARAGMSKKTLYQIFPNKEAVLTAFLRGYEQDPPLAALPASGYEPIEEFKTALVDIAEYVLRPPQIAVSRLVIAEARNSPEVSARFYEVEVMQVRLMLKERIKRLQSDGILSGQDASVVADFALSAVIGHEHFDQLMGTHETPAVDRNKLRERADVIVALYCP